jgi:di/tricarboxylate transporter
VYVATVILCNIVGNNAAAALMFPIAAGAADKQGIENSQMSFLLMLAASASFMSPFGYQTNLMVYGPGGYVFANFLKFGAPMQVVQLIVSVSVVLLDDKWWIGWVVGFSVVVGIYVVRLVWPHIRRRFVRDASSASSSRSRLDNIQENL